MISRTSQPGNLFNFDDENYDPLWLYMAQAGGWMYPMWAVSTALPLYIGLKDSGWWCSVGPCILMAYGMLILGGSLYAAFAFVTVLPTIYHDNDIDE